MISSIEHYSNYKISDNERLRNWYNSKEKNVSPRYIIKLMMHEIEPIEKDRIFGQSYNNVLVHPT